MARSDTARAAVVAGVAVEAIVAAIAGPAAAMAGRSGWQLAAGVGVAGVFFAAGMLAIWAILRFTTVFAQVGALAVFAVQVLLLAGLFDLGRAPGFDRGAFAGGVILGTAAWQATLVAVFRRVRERVYAGLDGPPYDETMGKEASA